MKLRESKKVAAHSLITNTDPNETAGNVLDIIEDIPSNMFLSYNTDLGPPYRVLLDTNFICFTIQKHMDIFQGLMDCFMAKCIPHITDCVVGEIEKMGHRKRLTLQVATDPRIVRLTCQHKGTYADDCIFNRISEVNF